MLNILDRNESQIEIPEFKPVNTGFRLPEEATQKDALESLSEHPDIATFIDKEYGCVNLHALFQYQNYYLSLATLAERLLNEIAFHTNAYTSQPARNAGTKLTVMEKVAKVPYVKGREFIFPINDGVAVMIYAVWEEPGRYKLKSNIYQ